MTENVGMATYYRKMKHTSVILQPLQVVNISTAAFVTIYVHIPISSTRYFEPSKNVSLFKYNLNKPALHRQQFNCLSHHSAIDNAPLLQTKPGGEECFRYESSTITLWCVAYHISYVLGSQIGHGHAVTGIPSSDVLSASAC